MEGLDLVEQALSNLVKQFARPMDFLRELVQNSIDAGSPRIEVRVRWVPSAQGGVAEIEVADFGSGMDETIIDSQLTRLFSSLKEGDRTSIGKFGIGFTSVFALQPALVRVITGRQGEDWELLFHADRSFEKRPYEEQVRGTTITVYKRMAHREVASLVDEARATLIDWCEHANTPIDFYDETATESPDEGPAGEEDVFAIAAPVPRETLNTPFTLPDCEHQTKTKDNGIETVVGYTDTPFYGFFSGGLTLLRSANIESLDSYSNLAHLAFKVRSPRIEHTLTRDNVIIDGGWHEAMGHVAKAARQLRTNLEDALIERAQAGGEVGELHQWLVPDLNRERLADDRPIFVDLRGRARSLRQSVVSSIFGKEAWLLGDSDPALAEALLTRGIPVLKYHPATLALLRKSLDGHLVANAAEIFALVEPMRDEDIPTAERRLFDRAAEFLGRPTKGSLHLAVCELDGETSTRSTLFVEGRAKRGLFRKPIRHGWWGAARSAWLKVSGLVFDRWFLVNRLHPHIAALLCVAEEDLDLAAYALAQVLMVDEDGFDEVAMDGLNLYAQRIS